MIDYYQNLAGFDAFSSALTGLADPAPTGARDEVLAAVSAEPGSALLGVFMHHLIGHAASDGAEIALLQRAASLWQQGVTLCDGLAQVRSGLEDALENPTDAGSPDKFNAAGTQIQTFRAAAVDLSSDIDALRAEVMTFPHLPRHPRQTDLSTDQWDWGDLTMARRTEALMRSVSSLAQGAGDQASTAFATGAISSYATNVAGSAYLTFVVGGPRRSHRQRHRIARNAVGSWFRANGPAGLSTSEIADRLSNATLPPGIGKLLKQAIAQTFDLGKTLPPPDLEIGYQRLVQHLRLLDGFPYPAMPAAPSQHWMSQLYADPQNPPSSLKPQDIDVVEQDGGGLAGQMGPNQPGSSQPSGSDSSGKSKGCGILVLIIIAVDLIQAFVQCIVQWAGHSRCTFWDNMLLSKVWQQDKPDPHDPNGPANINTTSEQLTAISESPQASSLVFQLSDLHNQAWEALDKAYKFLSITGLIYPQSPLPSPVFTQFTAMPPSIGPWPHREMESPPYHLYPTSPIEQPTVSESPFPPGTSPQDALDDRFEGVSAIGVALWTQIAKGQLDSSNFDLDGDRDREHPCWATDGSINDDPLNVRILAYSEQ